MEYALLRCVRAALLDARSISKLLLRDAHVRSASRNVLRTHVIVNPSVKLVHSRMFFRNVVHKTLVSQCDREKKKSTSTTKFSTRQLYTADPAVSYSCSC